jgi:fibronectin type 3 domain-containing protein
MAMYTRMALLFLVLLSGCNWLDSETPATNLASLSISVGQFEPAFSSSTLEYAATVPADTVSITLTLSASHISDTVTVNGASVNSMSGSINVPLDPGANTITIVVSSADQSRTRTYTVVVTRTVLVYSVGGSVSGLAGTLTLQNNGVDNLGIAADGAFVFKTSVIDGGDYQITVSTQPDGQLCSVTNGTGTIDSADVTDVAVDCVDLFSGLFVDDLVVGLDYTCSSGSVSETASDGQFTCPQSDDISFWLGSNELGPVPVSYAIISPILLFPDDGLAAVNLARLLQTLDSDQLPDNGVIVINESLVATLPADLDFSLQAAEFEDAVGMTLVSVETAVQRLREGITQYVPENTAPIADAGADRDVIVGATVALSGAGSSDANGDGLTFHWNFVSTPAGSSAQLASRFSVAPSFVADVAGSYVVGVLVSDGTVINYDIVVITANEGSALPAAPQGLQAVAGDARVTLSWTAVDGATGYIILSNTTGGVTDPGWVRTGPYTGTVITFGELTNGTTYYYWVSAVNASGEGPMSAGVSATPEAQAPGLPAMPDGVQAIAGDSLVAINWTAVSGATSYTVYWNTTGGVDDSDASLAAGSSTGFTHSGLSNGTTYYYRVAASNASGEGPLSAERSATPVAAGPAVPGAPVGLLATAGDGEVALSWTAVSGATSYTVYWNTTGGVSTSDAYLDAGSAIVISHTGLTNDTRYYYRVSASNDAGESTLSSEVSAYPSAVPMPPDEPQNLRAFPGDGVVTLVWDDVGGADSYTVYWSTDGYVSFDSENVSVLSNTYTFTGLASGTTYSYGVSATNTNGEGFLSAELRVTQKTDWQWMNPQPSGLDFKGLAGCNDIFVGVTDSGGIYTSADSGVNWAANNSGTLEKLASVACDGTRFVVVGDNGSLLTSHDGGVAWLKLATSSSLNKVIWAGDQFVGVGSGAAMTSPDGLSWSTTYVGVMDTIAWSGSQYVGTYFYGGGVVYTSPDAITWTEHSTSLASIEEIVWAGTEFVAIPSNSYAGNVFTSTDGVTWTDTGSGPSVNLLFGSIIWDGSQLVGTGQNGLVFTSNDGITWTTHSTPTGKQLNAIGTNGTTYLAGGYGGTVLSSTTLTSWSLQLPEASLTQDLLWDILWDGSRFIAVGGNFSADVILTSGNGITWAASDNGAGYGGLRSIAYNGSTYVAVGVSGRILSSPDGANWTSRTSGVSSGNLDKVIWADTQFVAVGGYNDIITSPDGVTWTSRLSGAYPAPSLQSVAWDGSMLVVVGTNYQSSHVILSSQDAGATWASETIFSQPRDVIWANGQFLVTGWTSYTYTSTNGIDWTRNSPTGIVDSGYLGFIEWDGTQFVGNITNLVYTSTDGIAWDPIQNTGLSENKIGFEAMAWGDSGQVVGVGIEGMILLNPSW